MADDLTLPTRPSGCLWDITVANDTVSVCLRSLVDQAIVAHGGSVRFGENESETFIAATVVSLAEKALREYERALKLTARFRVKVSAY